MRSMKKRKEWKSARSKQYRPTSRTYWEGRLKKASLNNLERFSL